jgi:hypothetical protein
MSAARGALNVSSAACGALNGRSAVCRTLDGPSAARGALNGPSAAREAMNGPSATPCSAAALVISSSGEPAPRDSQPATNGRPWLAAASAAGRMLMKSCSA